MLEKSIFMGSKRYEFYNVSLFGSTILRKRMQSFFTTNKNP